MSRKAHGQLRRGQVITTYGPGALIELPAYSAIVGGLDTWPNVGDLEPIDEPRLARKLAFMTGVPEPDLFAPPPVSTDPRAPTRAIGAWRFPQWFVVRDDTSGGAREGSRRLVHRRLLDPDGRFERRQVVATRFVRACPKGHVDDLDWIGFVHEYAQPRCIRPLWLDERGTSGDLGDLFVRCECGRQRSLYEATILDANPLRTCRGRRPWLGQVPLEDCNLPSRLLIRTASNAYFSQVVSVLSLPERGTEVESAVREVWNVLHAVDAPEHLTTFRRLAQVAEKLAPFSDDEVMEAIREIKGGKEGERPVKQVELEALLAAPEGYGDDVPVDPNFHARRLPESVWRRSTLADGVAAVVQLHRLREVSALIGFTRFEAVMPDIHGEYETDVERADLAIEPKWFPAVENRGEGLFLQLRSTAIRSWLGRAGVAERLDQLRAGHDRWADGRKSKRLFPGGPYVLLHTLSHLLIQSLSMRCGYPASSISERIYSDAAADRYGILLYTGSPDAEGTLGGLVAQARHIESHLTQALRSAALCSNDPICAQHAPVESLEGRWLHGSACHGCTLIAEPSCEMRNDYLDRALVVPVLGLTGAAFFPSVT